VRRTSTGSDDGSLELVLKNFTGLEDDIKNLMADFNAYENDYGGSARSCDGLNDELACLHYELETCRSEFSNVRSKMKKYKDDFQNFKADLEKRIATLEKNADTRLDEIACEIEKTNSTIFSVVNAQA